MSLNHIIPVSNGLFEHRDRIGSAIWEFLWCIDRITAEESDAEGERWGIVLGGMPVKHERIALEIGCSKQTVKRNMNLLRAENYITTVRAPYGEIIKVRKNKKLVEKRSIKNGLSLNGEVSKMDSLFGENDERSIENELSNKDLKDLDLKISSSASLVQLSQQEIENRVKAVEDHFIKKRNLGLTLSVEDHSELTKAVKDGIPVSLLNSSIDLVFAKYKAKHRMDKIRTLTYCLPHCYDEWAKSITENVPSEPVAIGSSVTHPHAAGESRPRTSSRKNEIALQKIKEAEERERKRSEETILQD